MKKHLVQIVDEAEKYLMQLEHNFKMGCIQYESAVGSVVGIISFVKSIVVTLSYDAYLSTTFVECLLERLANMQLGVNSRLFTMEYE